MHTIHYVLKVAYRVYLGNQFPIWRQTHYQFINQLMITDGIEFEIFELYYYYYYITITSQ
jgi:hypothetical protein